MKTSEQLYVVMHGLNGEGYRVIPEGTVMIAVYRRVFGPATRAACDAYVESHGDFQAQS